MHSLHIHSQEIFWALVNGPHTCLLYEKDTCSLFLPSNNTQLYDCINAAGTRLGIWF